MVVHFLAALAAGLLLVDAEELGELAGFARKSSTLRAVERVEFVRKRMAVALRGLDVEEPLARGLDPLVLGHLGDIAAREIHHGRGRLLSSHGDLR